jgi:hypothetical protein
MRTVSLGASESTLPSECQLCGGQLSTAIEAFWPTAPILGQLFRKCRRPTRVDPLLSLMTDCYQERKQRYAPSHY